MSDVRLAMVAGAGRGFEPNRRAAEAEHVAERVAKNRDS
jgi:hypothetical protein